LCQWTILPSNSFFASWLGLQTFQHFLLCFIGALTDRLGRLFDGLVGYVFGISVIVSKFFTAAVVTHKSFFHVTGECWF
jgi:hypothetical protein